MATFEARITRAVNQYRRRLAAHDRAAAAVLGDAYRDILVDLRRRLDELTRRIEDAREAGEPVGISWLYQERRFRSLVAQTEAAFRKLAQTTEQEIAKGKRLAAATAEAHAQEMIRASLGPPPAGVSLTLARLPQATIANLVGAIEAGSPLRAILDGYGADAADDVRTELVRGVAAGIGSQEIARNVARALDGNLRRARLIARTEILRAARETTRETYRASGVVKRWRWHAAKTIRTCASCWANDGREFALETPMAEHPAGRCSMLPVTMTWRELGVDVPEDRPELPTGPEAFRLLSASMQDRILGSAAAGDAYRVGEVTLGDFVRVRRSRDWGETRTATGLARARRNAEKRTA